MEIKQDLAQLAGKDQIFLYLQFYQSMKESKYHTIDPIILDTLNLNERRMKHIIEILHGNQRQKFTKTQRKPMGRPFFRNESLASVNQQKTELPPISSNPHKDSQKNREKEYFSPDAKLKGIRLNKEPYFNHSINTNQSLDNSQSTKRNKTRYETGPKSQRHLKHERSAQQDIINLEQQILNLQQDKKQQLMRDYMTNKLKRSKSQEINPKDLYRLQIENLISELTPIQQLQQSEDRMRRLKRKHRHLSTFDKNYYKKLNQHDMLILF